MEEEALNEAWTLFTRNGYKGDVHNFKNLISRDEAALKDAHALFSQGGYKGNVDAFGQLVGVKKKVPTALPSDSVQEPSTAESSSEDGFSLFAPTTDGQPRTEGFDTIPEQIVNEPVAELYDQYLEAGVITPTQTTQIDETLEKQKKGDRTLWEDIDALATGMLNTGYMIPLYKYDKREDLLQQQTVKNRINFLEALPEEKVKELNAFAVRKSGDLSTESRNVFAENSIIEEKSRMLINNIKHVENSIRQIKQSGKDVPVEGVEHYQGLIRELQGMANKYNDNVDVIESNNDDIGTFHEELEFFKKNYGGLEYYQDIMRLSAADLIAGVSEFGSSTLKKVGNSPYGYRPLALEWEQFNKEFRGEVARQREFIKPMMSVSDIDNANDFGKWLLEQSSAQIPVITVLAAGGSPIGLTALGTSSAGQKMGQLRDANDETMKDVSSKREDIAEMNRLIEEKQSKLEPQRDAEGVMTSIPFEIEGEPSLESMIEQRDKAVEDLGKVKDKTYSETEMYIAGLGVGAAEVLSERVTLGILSKGKRTLQAAGRSKMSPQIKAGIKDRVFGITRDAMSEGGSEFINQIAQNSIDILYLDNQDVHVLDGTEDALASGMAMGAGMNSAPALIGMGAKTFMKREDIDQVKADSKKASDLLDEVERKKDILDDKSKDMLTKKARQIIKGNNKKITKAYDEIAASLPKEDITKLINIDKKANVILKQANAIKDMDIEPDIKQELQQDLEREVEKLREQKNEIIDTANQNAKEKAKLEAKERAKVKAELEAKSEAEMSDLKKELVAIDAPQKIIDAVGNDTALKESFLADTSSIAETVRSIMGVRGDFSSKENTIRIGTMYSKIFGGRSELLIHEAVHAATVSTLKDVFKNPDGYTKEQVEAATELNDIAFDYMMNNSTTAKLVDPLIYGTSNVYEFVAEFISNKKFRDWIGKNDQSKEQSLLQHIWSRVLQTLGIKKVDINEERVSKVASLIDKTLDIRIDNLNRAKEAKEIDVVIEDGGSTKTENPVVDATPKGVDNMAQQKPDSNKGPQVPKTTTPAEPVSDSDSNTEQRRDDGLTSERIPAVKKTPTSKPKKIRDIMSNVSKKLKSTTIYGKTRGRNTVGTYHPSNSLVKIRDAGDLDTTAHELGHMLDDRHQVLESIAGDPVITKQLDWYSERGGSNPPKGVTPAVAKEYLMREGLAEFIRAYVANPEAAKKKSPELYAHFESTVDPETIGILQEFSNDFINFANAPSGEQILANIETSTLPNKKGAIQWLKDRFKSKDKERFYVTPMDKFKTSMTNSMQVANKAFRFINGIKGNKPLKPEENFEVMSRLFAGINGKINSFLANGIRTPKNELMKDSQGNILNIDYLFDGLNTSSEATLRQDMNDVMSLLVAERTVEYAEKFKRTSNLTGVGGGIKSDISVALEHLNDVEALKTTDKAKYDRIKEGARRYREFADAGLKYALESGRLSQEGYNTIKENNRYYVSLARNKEIEPGEDIFTPFVTSSQLASPKDVIKKARGGSDAIKNPYVSLMKNTVSIIKESDRNAVMQSFIDPLNVTRSMGDGKVANYAQIARPAKKGESNTISLFVDGKEETYQFDKDIYAALKQLHDMTNNGILIKAMKPVADLIRHTVTTFPIFALRNVVRDTQSRLIVSRTGATPADLFGTKKLKEAFETFGGSQAGFYLINEKAYNKELEESVKKLTKKGVFVVDPRNLRPDVFLKKLGKSGKKFGEKLENVNRMAEYKSAYRKAKKQGMDDYNAGLYAAFQARDLMDFAVAGTWMKEINKIIPFSNAAVQSVKRSVKGAKEDPATFAYKMALVSLLPQVLVRVLVANMGDDEEYEQLPDYQRDLFYNFKTPIGNDWVAIPKPFELGLVSSIMDRGVSYAMGNDKAFEGATMSTIHTLFPFDESTLMGPFRPLLEAAINKDLFRDRDIVPYWEKDKALELREGTKYASRVGATLSDGFGLIGAEVDPRSIDHIIKGFTTYYGDFGLTLFDIGKKDSRNQFDFTNTGFVKGMPVSNAKSVQKAVELAEDIGEQNTKPIKQLKGVIKVYYDMDDPEAKKKMAKLIYNYAEQLVENLEKKKEALIKQKKASQK